MAKSVTAAAEKENAPKHTAISKAEFQKIYQDYRLLKDDLDTARGNMGSMIKTAEENKGINRRMAKVAFKLAGQELIAAQSDIRALLTYCQHLGIFDQKDLLDDLPHSK